MSKLTRMFRSAREIHDDERGLEALQVVMIVAIAAVCLIVIKSKWSDIKTFFTDNVTEGIKWEGGKDGAAKAGG